VQSARQPAEPDELPERQQRAESAGPAVRLRRAACAGPAVRPRPGPCVERAALLQRAAHVERAVQPRRAACVEQAGLLRPADAGAGPRCSARPDGPSRLMQVSAGPGACRAFAARRLGPRESRHPWRKPRGHRRTPIGRPAWLRKSEKTCVSCGSSSPGGSACADSCFGTRARTKSAQRQAAMPTTRQNYGGSPPCRSVVKAIRLMGTTSQATNQARRSTSNFLMSAIALAGLRPFGQALAQFRMVWHR
jgi:hypothetical protein